MVCTIKLAGDVSLSFPPSVALCLDKIACERPDKLGRSLSQWNPYRSGTWCCMRQIANRQLWIGNAGDLRDPHVVMAAGIEAVVELADNEQMASLPRDLIRLRFPLSDGGQNAGWLLRLAADSVAALSSAGVPTLVCCSCGLNRSVCVASSAIALAENHAFEEVLIEVGKAGPSDVSPGLLADFRAALSS